MYPDISIEPKWQPLNGHVLRHATTNKEDNAQAGIQARGFWGNKTPTCNCFASFDRKTILIEQLSSTLRRFLSNRPNSIFCSTPKNHQRLVTMDFRAVSSLFLRLGSFTVEAVEDNSASHNLFGNLTSGHLIHRNQKITRNKR